MQILHPLARLSRRTQVIAALVVLAVVAAATWQLTRPATTATQTMTATASTSTFQTTVTGAGTVEPAEQADLSFDVSGRVTAVKVEAGDTVTKGQVLAELDTVSLDAALASAEAQLTAAQTTAANDGGESSTQQASNTAAVAVAEADVESAEDDLDAATLKAPIAGTVAAVDVEVGDQAGSSSGGSSAGGDQAAGQTGTATTESAAAVTVISPDTFQVETSIGADDIESVKTGLQAQITPNGATEAIFGTVTEVGRVAETGTDGTATFPVTVKITGAQEDLYSGTTASVAIITESRDDVLSVPTLAVQTDGDETYVNQVVDGDVTKTPVTIGATNGQSTEITEGLAEGDTVQLTSMRVRQGDGEQSGEGGFPGGGMMGGGQGGPPSGGGFPGGTGGGPGQ